MRLCNRSPRVPSCTLTFLCSPAHPRPALTGNPIPREGAQGGVATLARPAGCTGVCLPCPPGQGRRVTLGAALALPLHLIFR